MSAASARSDLRPFLQSPSAFFRVWDDSEMEKIFDKYKTQSWLSAEQLQAALRELGVQDRASSEPVDLNRFKTIARRPSERAQSMPLAQLLEHSLGPTDVAALTDDEICRGLRVFGDRVLGLVRDKIRLMKETVQVHGELVFKIFFFMEFDLCILQACVQRCRYARTTRSSWRLFVRKI